MNKLISLYERFNVYPAHYDWSQMIRDEAFAEHVWAENCRNLHADVKLISFVHVRGYADGQTEIEIKMFTWRSENHVG